MMGFTFNLKYVPGPTNIFDEKTSLCGFGRDKWGTGKDVDWWGALRSSAAGAFEVHLLNNAPASSLKIRGGYRCPIPKPSK